MHKNTIYALVAGLPLLLIHCTSDDKPTQPVVPAGESVAGLVINEFMADNDNINADPDLGEFADWIEIHNTGSEAVDMGGMYLTDDLEEPGKWQVPDGISIAAGGFRIFWADDEDMVAEAVHTNFRLGASGEQVGLYQRDGATPADTLSYGEQQTDVSYGRLPDGSDMWETFTAPTPGASNN